MATETTKAGAAAPATAGNGANETAENEIGIDVMREVAGRFGAKLPEPEEKPEARSQKPETEAGAEGAEDAEAESGTETQTDAEAGTETESETKPATEATEDEPEGTEDDAQPGEDSKAETAKVVGLKLKDLPADVRTRVQGVIDERIGKVVAKERAKGDELAARVTELETELTEAKEKGGAAPVLLPGTHPLLLAQSEAEIEARLRQIEAAEDFADRYQDGYPGGDDPQRDPPMEAAEIRKRWRELQRERDRVIPEARRMLKERATHEAELRTVAPTFFDRKSEDYRAVQARLKLMPELRRHANATTIAAQLILGERALAALKTKKPEAKAKPAPKLAPRVPGNGGGAKGSPGAQVSAQASGAEKMKKVMQQPGNKNAFEDAVAALL